MTKKKVTAPLTYNPGKGRPKEHLAYLNYQEMQALKRLNGNNMEMGPRGLPSFVPPPSGGSSSVSRISGGTAGSNAANYKSSTGGSSSVSRISGGTAGSNMGSYRSSTGGSSSVSRISGGTAGSNMGSYRSSSPGMGSYRSSDSGMRAPGASAAAARNNMGAARASTQGSAPRSISGIGSPADRAIKQAVESKNARDATRTPALKEDRSKTIGAGPMGMPVGLGGQTGGRIVGAIQAVRDLGVAGVPGGPTRVGVPAATIRTQPINLQTWAEAVSRGLGALGDPRQERIARTVAFSESVPGLRQPELARQLQSTALSGGNLFTYKGATPQQQALLNEISSTALHVSMKTGLDPRLVLGQAMHESATSESKSSTRLSKLAREYNNLFGVKSTGVPKDWDGVTTWSGESSVMPTGEHYGPKLKTYNEGFRVYETPQQSLMDYGRLISNKYEEAGKLETIPEQARAIKAGGYATDPDYAKKLARSAGRVGIGSDSVVVPAGGPLPGQVRPKPEDLMDAYKRKEIYDRIPEGKTIYDRIPEADIPKAPVIGRGIESFYDPMPKDEVSPFREALLPTGTASGAGMTYNPVLDRMIGKKEIYDRILPSDSTPPYDPLSGIRTPNVTAPAPEKVFDPIGDLERKIAMIEGYKNYRSPPGVPGVQYPRISEDPTMPGRTVTPSFEQSLYRGQLPAGMSFTPDIPGAQYPRISEDPTMPGRTVVPSPQQSLYTGIKAIPTQGTITGPWPGQNAYEPERIIKIEDVPLDVSPEYDVLSGIRVPEKAAQTERSAVVKELGGTEITVDGKARTASDAVEDFASPEESAAAITKIAGLVASGKTEFTPQEIYEIVQEVRREAVKPPVKDESVEPPAETEVVEEDNVPSRSVSPITDDIGDVQFPEKKIPQRVAERLPYLVGPSVKLADWLERRNWEKLSPSERRDLLDRWAAENAAYIRSSGADREGGGGIRDIVMGPTEYAQAPTTPTTPSEPKPEKSGPRPEIYYMWDLGVGIPSPGDPNYTQYQKYLIDTAAAQKAMGWA